MRLWGVNPTNSVVVPQRLQLRFIVLSKLVFLLWNADSLHQPRTQGLSSYRPKERPWERGWVCTFLAFFLLISFKAEIVSFSMVIFTGKHPLPLFCDRQVFEDIHECDGRELLPTHFDWWVRETCFAWSEIRKKATISLANLLVLSFPAECKLKIKLSKTVVSEKMVQSISVIQC